MQILYIEAEPNIRFDTSLLMRHLGHDVLAADSPQGALLLLQAASPDVVYADGIDAALEQAARARRPGIRVARGAGAHAMRHHATRALESALASAE